VKRFTDYTLKAQMRCEVDSVQKNGWLVMDFEKTCWCASSQIHRCACRPSNLKNHHLTASLGSGSCWSKSLYKIPRVLGRTEE